MFNSLEDLIGAHKATPGRPASSPALN